MRDSYPQSHTLYQGGTSNLIAGFFSDVRGGESVATANAKRAELCVNALAGINPEAVKGLMDRLTGLSNAWKELSTNMKPMSPIVSECLESAANDLDRILKERMKL